MGEVDQQSEHLSDAEIEQYGGARADGKAEAGDRPDPMETHLADCPACRSRVLASQRSRLALLTNAAVNTNPRADNPGPGPDCPGEDDLRNLAAGLCPPDSAAKLTRHAAECDHCGPLLRMYSEDFSDDLAADDQAALGKLKSSSSGWQKKLAEEMFAGQAKSAAKSDKNPFAWRWVWAPTALAACAAIAFAVWYSPRETPEKVEKLLAQAYSEQRTIEMRFPGAAWGPMRATRGEVRQPRFSKPASLLEAEGIIGRERQKSSRSSAWSYAQAQAEILEGHPEAAINTVGRAPTGRSASAGLMTLAVANFEQGEISHDAATYERAMELFDEALQKDPKNTVALFNRAVTWQRLGHPDLAIRDWRTLLQFETDPAWAGEAKARLKKLQATPSSQ